MNPGEIVRDKSGNPLHPYCNRCGWRKGGIHSWDGNKCKCGHSEPAMRECVFVQFPSRKVTENVTAQERNIGEALP